MNLLNVFKKCSKYVLPPYCVLCSFTSDQMGHLCSICREDLPYIIFACKSCGLALEKDDIQRCGACLKDPFSTGLALVPFHYQPPIDHLVYQFKFFNDLKIAPVLAELLEHYLHPIYNEHWPQVIIPIPLHIDRLKERGFNQSLEIGKILSKKLGIPVDYDSFVRHKKTKTQSHLNAKLRAENMRNAFSLVKPLIYKHVAILDDVITTTQTIRSFSKILRKAGVERIDIWAVARA